MLLGIHLCGKERGTDTSDDIFTVSRIHMIHVLVKTNSTISEIISSKTRKILVKIGRSSKNPAKIREKAQIRMDYYVLF